MVGRGQFGNSGLVVVSVTVVTEVVTVAVVDGASVVVGAALVVGVTVVVTVVGGGGGAAVVLGAGAAVWVLGPGSGAGDSVAVTDDVVGATVVEVTAGLSAVPALVNLTTAYTSSARTAAVSTPRPTRTAGRWCHGSGGGSTGVVAAVGGGP